MSEIVPKRWLPAGAGAAFYRGTRLRQTQTGIGQPTSIDRCQATTVHYPIKPDNGYSCSIVRRESRTGPEVQRARQAYDRNQQQVPFEELTRCPNELPTTSVHEGLVPMLAGAVVCVIVCGYVALLVRGTWGLVATHRVLGRGSRNVRDRRRRGNRSEAIRVFRRSSRRTPYISGSERSFFGLFGPLGPLGPS